MTDFLRFEDAYETALEIEYDASADEIVFTCDADGYEEPAYLRFTPEVIGRISASLGIIAREKRIPDIREKRVRKDE